MSTESKLPAGFHGDYGSDDEESEARDLPCFVHTNTGADAVECQILYVPVGDVPSHACKARLANVEHWAKYGTIDFPAVPMASLPKQACALYTSTSGTHALCHLPARLASEDPVACTRELFRTVVPKLVVIMLERPHIEFKGTTAYANELVCSIKLACF